MTHRCVPRCQRGVLGSSRPCNPEEERRKSADGEDAVDDEQGNEEPFDLLVPPDRRETAVQIGTWLGNEAGGRH